jgi:hypothetical protein
MQSLIDQLNVATKRVPTRFEKNYHSTGAERSRRLTCASYAMLKMANDFYFFHISVRRMVIFETFRPGKGVHDDQALQAPCSCISWVPAFFLGCLINLMKSSDFWAERGGIRGLDCRQSDTAAAIIALLDSLPAQ